MSRWRTSLTVRVIGMFVLIVALAAAGLGVYLYRAFVVDIERRDDLQLLGKLRQVQLLLGRPGAQQLLRQQPDFFRDTMSGQENSLVRFMAPDGTVLADINASGERYPVPPSAGVALDRSAILSWTSSRGDPGRVVAGTARLGDGGVTVIVARVYVERSQAFAQYRRQIGVAVLSSALLAALSAAWMLHRGLRPLRVVAAHAASVTPGTLAQRLDAGEAPSELQPLIDALNAMLARLQQAHARLAGFSADLAHEFRTPVTNLLGQSQVMLAQPRSTDAYEQLIGSNIEELERLARMIESMLFLARSEQDDVMLARQPLAAEEELRNVADLFDGIAEERGLHLECVGTAVVLADPALLRRALANLLSNALRYADPDSTVTLQVAQGDGVVELSVANLGQTIGPEHLPHLFERFYRADAARAHGEGSTGLGLAIVRAIMELHGGTATVQVDGAVVRFTLRFRTA